MCHTLDRDDAPTFHTPSILFSGLDESDVSLKPRGTQITRMLDKGRLALISCPKHQRAERNSTYSQMFRFGLMTTRHRDCI